ncbi:MULTISPECIES: hypothetical protein [Oceanisphaera]|uniref:Uncharacterized protein n=1 Tax=Oceanisphaera ostreae TaxID=914151 RepID=A0ABW3KFA6_9GAMM
MTHHRLLRLANISMVIFLVVACAALSIAYLQEEKVSLGMTVFMHITLVISAALFKLAYVVRLIAQDKMGQPLV